MKGINAHNEELVLQREAHKTTADNLAHELDTHREEI
jgi:hypothetical protein